MSKRTVELTVAGLFVLIGALVMYDSQRLGAGWAADGPESGYFPFYIALLMLLASLVTFVRAVLPAGSSDAPFVDRESFGRVLSVLIPAAVFVAAVMWIGIYVAATLFIGYFMVVVGKYGLLRSVAVSVGVSLFFFVVFEIWFLVPLPKGPLEQMLGY